MSQESIKKIHDWLEKIDARMETDSQRLRRIENAVLGDENGDFLGHKHRIEHLESCCPKMQDEQRELNKRLDRVYWTAGILIIIASLIATLL